MKKILVPCDFSNPSQEAFKLAINIASQTKGEVIVLFAIYIPVTYDATYPDGAAIAYDPTFLTRLEDEAKKEFEKMKRKLASKNVKTNLEIIYGEIVASVKQTVKRRKIDVVIMGTTGASGIKETLIGSNTEKVVRHSPVPVLAVRTAPAIRSIKRILLPTNLELNQGDFLTKVKELQNFFNAKLHVLLVNTPAHFKDDREANTNLEKFAKHYKLKNYELHFRNYRNEDDGIIDFAHHEKIDLIAMGTHARKGLSHLFNGSITEDVVNHIKSPVWTYYIKK